MSRESDFGELRSWLSRPPTKEALEEVVRLLDGPPGEEPRREWLPYLQGALGRWHEAAPRTWDHDTHGYWHANDLFLEDHARFFDAVAQGLPSTHLYRGLRCEIWLEARDIDVFSHPRLDRSMV